VNRCWLLRESWLCVAEGETSLNTCGSARYLGDFRTCATRQRLLTTTNRSGSVAVKRDITFNATSRDEVFRHNMGHMSFDAEDSGQREPALERVRAAKT